MIKAVLFDLDGTLFDRESSVRSLVAAQYAAFRDRLAGVDQSTYVAAFITRDARGYVPKEQVYPELLHALGIASLDPATMVADFFARYHGHCRLYPSTRDTLETLRSRDLRLGIITNGGYPFQLRTIQALGIEGYFATILVSAAEGIKKPAPHIFQRATDRLGVTPAEAVFVGDHPVVDVEGAHHAGLRAVWKRDVAWHAPTTAYEQIIDLRELPDLLQRMGRQRSTTSA